MVNGQSNPPADAVMTGLVPVISIHRAKPCNHHRDCRVIGEQSDAVLRTAMPGNDTVPTPGRLRSFALVPAFLHFLNNLADKRLKVARVARGDDTVVGHDFGIFPLAAGIDHVSFDRFVRRHLAAFREAGLDQEPRRVAHRRNRLAGIVERLDQLERIRIDAQQIGINLAARQHDGVVIVRLRGRQQLVDRHRPAPIRLVPAGDLTLLRRHDIHRGARRFPACRAELQVPPVRSHWWRG
jgi:hypothetical protein